MVGAEPLYPEQRALIAATFPAQIYDFYGASEASCLGFTCPANGELLHLCDDTAIVELLCADGTLAKPGLPSNKLALTNLFNTLLPLIRYEIDDAVVPDMSEEACLCGSAFRRIASIEGRTDDTFAYVGGAFAHPAVFRSILARELAIVEYQVVQTARGATVRVVATAPFDAERMATQIANALSAHGVANPDVHLVEVQGFPRSASGKIRRFVPLPMDSRSVDRRPLAIAGSA
jgi:phenylacetate-coenzyme A ligase PaaK-like adenylate-forming protein